MPRVIINSVMLVIAAKKWGQHALIIYVKVRIMSVREGAPFVRMVCRLMHVCMSLCTGVQVCEFTLWPGGSVIHSVAWTLEDDHIDRL